MQSQAAENRSIQNDPLKEALQRLGPAPSSKTPPGATTETLEPPRKPKTRRGVFEGDAAAIELRARLAQARHGIPPVAARHSAPSRLGAALRFSSFVLVAAALAGAAGYLAGAVRLSTKSARLAAPYTGPDMPLVPLTQAAPRNAPDGKSRPLRAAIDGAPATAGQAPHNTVAVEAAPQPDPPAAPRNAPDSKSEPQRAVIDGAPATAGRAPHDAVAVEAAPQPEPPASPSAPQPSLPRPDASEIAARMKIGGDLMAAGDVAAARTMFERVAEAGDAAGAFAVAETYDPAVLRTLHFRGGITPDPALARRWYEKARDMGSSAAPERIARLTSR